MRMTPTIACLAILVFAGCATHGGYGEARFREREYGVNRIALTNGGLTREQIRIITSTRPHESFPLDISIIVIEDGRLEAEVEQLFVSSVTAELLQSNRIDRVVPVPAFLLPGQLTFSGIQELGIRTLTEYVLVFVIDTESFFRWTKVLDTKYEIVSIVDFFLVDPQTTAIMASDRLLSTLAYEQNLFKTGERKKALEEVFAEQGRVVGEKLAVLFGAGA